MTAPASARIASVSPEFIEQAAPSAIEDWLSYFEPSIVLLTGESPAPRAESALRRRINGDTHLFHPAGNARDGAPQIVDGIQFVFATTFETLREISDVEGEALDPTIPTFVLSDLLELSIDTTALSTTLEGREEYVSKLGMEQLDGEYVHISTRLPEGYRREWDGLTVIGGGVEAGRAETPLVALDCRADGVVLTRKLNRTQLGLRALDQVGQKRAQKLRDAGFESRSDVAGADRTALQALPGVGRTTAERIQHSANAIANGEVVRTSDEPLPNGEPIYIDIETDGLNPTITWLVGVLDGSAADGNYMPFIQRDPDEPGRAIEDFMAWYTANASHRPLLAYHGWEFDFDVIHDHIVEYCPHYEGDWSAAYRFDPYRWAVTKGHALFPGRTNKLEDVAAALGYERATTGLTGAAVARSYQQWMSEQSPATEPDWERFKAYCEDDVRSLATVYEALEASGRIISSRESSRNATESTTQRSLSDW
jgi:uncharacterized protein YprB with RNaseH-like and TPR domain